MEFRLKITNSDNESSVAYEYVKSLKDASSRIHRHYIHDALTQNVQWNYDLEHCKDGKWLSWTLTDFYRDILNGNLEWLKKGKHHGKK